MKILGQFLILIWLLILPTFCSAQAPIIDWQKTPGSSGNELFQDIYQCADGNYIILGIADSTNDDVTCSIYGQHDSWVIKSDPEGNILWQRNFGGSKEEANPFSKIIQTSDGGFLIITESWSNDFDAIGHHKHSDVLTIKLDSTGDTQWTRSFGGSKLDVPRDILELPGHKYAILSRTTSSDGDVPFNPDTTDFNAWFFIVNNDGEIVENHVYGGSNDDDLHKIVLDDGDLALFGFTNSEDGDLNGLNVDSTDAWLLKVDHDGNILSSMVYGGHHIEKFIDAFKIPDGGYIAFGETGDPGIPVEKGFYHGSSDFWAVRLNEDGDIAWQGIYGGAGSESFARAAQVPGNTGFYLTGGANSTDGDVQIDSSHGIDLWLLQIDSSGTLMWSLTYGGTNIDYASAILNAGVLAGGTASTDGDVEDVNGTSDGWLLHFAYPTEAGIVDHHPAVMIFPNPATNMFGIQTGDALAMKTIEIENVFGQLMYSTSTALNKINLDVSEWPSGMYFLVVSDGLKGNLRTVKSFQVQR